jgi:hypothetical protein
LKGRSWRKDNAAKVVKQTFAHVVMIAIQKWPNAEMVCSTTLVTVKPVSKGTDDIVKVFDILKICQGLSFD